jgi:hypothetical protein
MSPPQLSPDQERQLALERRANALREAILADTEFVADIWAGEQAIASGDSLTLDEFERALDAMDAE